MFLPKTLWVMMYIILLKMVFLLTTYITISRPEKMLWKIGQWLRQTVTWKRLLLTVTNVMWLTDGKTVRTIMYLVMMFRTVLSIMRLSIMTFLMSLNMTNSRQENELRMISRTVNLKGVLISMKQSSVRTVKEFFRI